MHGQKNIKFLIFVFEYCESQCIAWYTPINVLMLLLLQYGFLL